ncbi:MerR family transcriptional regulator [Pelagibacterium lentulum]|uniref:MerR family transcriptional regulator n=1 Tax=Pelagibacterium lentulum TaxID=2029865 RepID=A0A916RF26_9HYPH|nr:MerR family transcriptional regulator [Pelagibacterium lentulum]GGA51160.1 MerR family transcriptional regulator [Pelagibacterium lentulum]
MDKSPDAFRTISEAADELDLPQHVLRFWETRFNQIKPLKRGGGRRYYRPDDVQLLKGIRYLLYDQGFTIKGVQRILKEQGARHVVAIGETGSIQPVAPQTGAVPESALEYYAEPALSSSNDIAVEAAPHVQAGSRSLDADQMQRLQDALDLLERCRLTLDKARNA